MKYLFLISVAALILSSCNEEKEPDNGKNTVSDSIETTKYIKKAEQYAGQTQKILGKNLKKAIKNNGINGAISFCNEKAFFLTDSTAKANKIKIKRVSDKNRNSNNKAEGEQLNYILNSKEEIKAGKTPAPEVIFAKGEVTVFLPLYTNQMCLQCHGNETTDIKEETSELLKKLYPEDKATGYTADELRGIWVVTMPEK